MDAILYYGKEMTRATVMSPTMCVDDGYMKTLRTRMELVGLKPEIDQLNQYRASQRVK